MREHKYFQQSLAIYDDLNVEEKQCLHDHLQACQECTATLASYRAMDRAVHGLVQAKVGQAAVQMAFGLQSPFALQKKTGRTTSVFDWLRHITLPHRYGLRLAGAVLLLFLLMVLSALFGGWGPFEEPVLASTPTVEHQQLATAAASSNLRATPVGWKREAGRADFDPIVPLAPVSPELHRMPAVAVTPQSVLFFNAHFVYRR